MHAGASLVRLAAALAAIALTVAPARGQERAPSAEPPRGSEPTRPPVLVVDDLVGDDWRAARAAQDEVARIGAAAGPPLLRARAQAPASAARREPIDRALRGLVRALADEVGAPLEAAAERVSADAALGGVAGTVDRDRPDLTIPELTEEQLGDAGSISTQAQRDWWGRRVRARRARGALLHLGPAITGFLLDVPPVRAPLHAAVLQHVAGAIYAAERRKAMAPGGAQALRAAYRGVVDLAAPVVAAGLRDEHPAVRAAFQAIRDDAVEGALAALDAPDPDARAAAEVTLGRLDQLAAQALARVARGEDPAHASPGARALAARLARRSRLGVTPELVRRLGDDLEGYEALDFRARRARVIELERLGGEEAIPALRALLREETSDEVRTMAAIGLFRLKDPVGAEWLTRHGAGLPLARISKHELSAIFMDQGLRYLKAGRFERAEREFKAALELEPSENVAWYNLACVYSLWGKLDLAFEHLRKAVERGFDDVSHMEKDTDLDPLRKDARYKAIIDGIKRSRGEPVDPERPEEPGKPGGGEGGRE